MKKRSVILVTVSGRDAPGITSELTGVLAKSDATILDIGQAVIHKLLSLSILFEIDGGRDQQVPLKDLLFKANELGMKLEFQVLSKNGDHPVPRKVYRYALTLIADRVSAQALHEVSTTLAKYKLNIDVIERLSEEEFGSVEIIASSLVKLNQAKLRQELLQIATKLKVDIALQNEGLFRRSKRMVVLDMDSTLIQSEVIDEFARELGVHREVSKITERTMQGKIRFDQSLKLRCAKLKGLRQEDIDRVYKRIKLTPGAADLIKVLKKLGYKIAVISGGFTSISNRLKIELGLDYAFANTLVMNNGVATGHVTQPIVNARRKAQLLEDLAKKEGIHLDQVIAIGDGANDLQMLQKAGLGIAFNAKPIVKEKAHLALNQKNLRSILYLLGIPGRDFSEILF